MIQELNELRRRQEKEGDWQDQNVATAPPCARPHRADTPFPRRGATPLPAPPVPPGGDTVVLGEDGHLSPRWWSCEHRRLRQLRAGA